LKKSDSKPPVKKTPSLDEALAKRRKDLDQSRQQLAQIQQQLVQAQAQVAFVEGAVQQLLECGAKDPAPTKPEEENK
jgi:phospholipase/lecithinase/hemolysin